MFVCRELRRYRAEEPWLVGQYFPLEDATGDLDRLTNGAIVGAATLAVAVLLALLIGLSMARSIRTITSAAESIERLESTGRSIAARGCARSTTPAQSRQGARRAEVVRGLRAPSPGLPVDGARRGCRALAPA